MRILTFLICVAFVPTAGMAADLVILKNQDRLTGTVGGLAGGKLSFRTEYAGKIEIDWTQVLRLRMENPLHIELQDGSQAESSIEPARDGVARVASPDLPSEVALSDIVSIQKPAALETRPRWLRHWSGQAQLGYNLTTGNSETENLAIAFRPQRTTEKDRIKAGYQLLRSMQDESEVNSIQDGSLRYDRFLDSKKLFLFGLAGFSTNRRQELDLRTRFGGGAGYSWVLSDQTAFSFYGGATAVQEKYEGLPRDNQTQGLAGFDLRTRWLGLGSFATQAEYEPRFSEDRYLLRWDAQLQFPLFRNFTFGLEVFDRYNSNPQSLGTKKNDFGILSALGWTF